MIKSFSHPLDYTAKIRLNRSTNKQINHDQLSVKGRQPIQQQQKDDLPNEHKGQY